MFSTPRRRVAPQPSSSTEPSYHNDNGRNNVGLSPDAHRIINNSNQQQRYDSYPTSLEPNSAAGTGNPRHGFPNQPHHYHQQYYHQPHYDPVYFDDSKVSIPPYLRDIDDENSSNIATRNGRNDPRLVGPTTTAASSGSQTIDDIHQPATTPASSSRRKHNTEADAAGGVLNRVSSLGMISEMALSSSTNNGVGTGPRVLQNNRRQGFTSPPGLSTNTLVGTAGNGTDSGSTVTATRVSSSSLPGRHQPNLRNTSRSTDPTSSRMSRTRSLSPKRRPDSNATSSSSRSQSHSYYATIDGGTYVKPSWRLRDRMKTAGVGLIMSLNVGTDPPDIVKPNPCAKLQCWMDPSSMTRSKAKEAIGERLEHQYARWQQQRTARPLKYRKALDPTVEDVRALCLWLRRQARQERVLLHYNGHGVPRPTSNGEIWVFDKNHTEYIPLSVSDLRQWAGKPTIVILDCSSAGILIPALTAPPRETPNTTPTGTPTRGQSPPTVVGGGGNGGTTSPDNILRSGTMMEGLNRDDIIVDGIPIPQMDMETAASHWVKDTIVLCPTSADEWLPMHPDYPADIFTACLTTPIKMALRWFVRNNRQSMGILLPPSGGKGGGTNNATNSNSDLDLNIPGSHTDRKTPLGELNWIFTAVTDSIAWNMLPKPLFQRLFRQDLLVASMFRNFLLADRILRSMDCTPQSYPPLPYGISDHPLWMAWDLACETCLFGLIQDGVLGGGGGGSKSIPRHISSSPHRPATGDQSSTSATTSSSVSSPFFFEQLTAFEVWLDYAEIYDGSPQYLESPEQLPVVLQVLLFQVHRVRALELLRRFLQLGPWAVNLALSLGIFPYVLKLLQSPDYKGVLLNIWASILKFDPSCQVDLVKDKALPHFIQPISAWAASPEATMGHVPLNILDSVRQRTLCAFALAATCYKYSLGQIECLNQNLHVSCASLLGAQIKLEEQQRNQKEQHRPSQRPSNDASRFQLLPAITREWLCICIGNLTRACRPAQIEAFNANVHVCLMTTQQKDSDPNVRAAATYALGCLLEYAPIPSPSPSSSSLSSPSSSMTRMAAQQQMPTAVAGAVPTPAPISLGPQAFSSGVVPVSQQQFRPIQQMQGNPQDQSQVFLPQQIPPGLSASGILSSNQLQIAAVNQGYGPQSTMHHANRLGPVQGTQPVGTVPLMGLASTNQSIMAGRPVLSHGLQLGSQPSGQMTFLQQQQQQQPLLQPGSGRMQTGVQPTTANQLGPTVLGNAPPPGTSPPIGMPLGTSPPLIAPLGFVPPGMQQQQQQQNPQQSRRKPTVFDDRRRVEFDLQVMESMIRVLNDGSPTVRFEVVMAFSSFAEKYAQALLVVAEDSLRAQDGIDIQALVDDKNGKDQRKSKPSSRVVSVPKGVNQMIMDRFTKCWKSLRKIQHEDPHPRVSEASNTIVRVIHEIFLDMRMEKEAALARDEEKVRVLTGIQEEGEAVDSGMERVRSDQHLLLSSPDSRGNISAGMPSSDGPINRLPSVKLHPLRRSASAQGVNDRDPTVVPSIPIPGQKQNLMDRIRAEKLLPKSELFLWKRSTFRPNCDDLDPEIIEDRDPLNPVDAARSYQRRRNNLVKDNGRRLAEQFKSLQPKRPDKQRSIDIIINHEGNDGDDDDDEKEEILKSDLKLREKQLLSNTGGSKMVSMVRFHSYEDALVVCDDENTVSVWNYVKEDRKLSFINHNPVGSRMTTSFWINESSSSHLFVGCDDGSARIWKGIIAGNGDISTHTPTLASAFFAIPGMESGQRGTSGLICEWQQKTGTLIAGGNSPSLSCWDLAAEKCSRTVDIEMNGCVTTLTTAWDDDASATQLGYRGMGPDIVVAGSSDGMLKVYDIRLSKAATAGPARNYKRSLGRKNQYPLTLDGHRSWIVETSFSCNGGQNEVLSGSVGGDMRAWDLRMAESVRAIEIQRSPMTALSIHPRIPIIASGSHAQFIKVLTQDGETLQVARFHEQGGHAGHRIGPISCLEFHKQKLVLAAGSSNSLVSIYHQRQ